jgi:ParB family transcriptional regulator, chromosome partitioning protein
MTKQRGMAKTAATAAPGSGAEGALVSSMPVATDAAPARQEAAARFEPAMALGQLRESPHNPRKVFEPEAMRTLEESIRAKGVQTPLLVREIPGDEMYDVAAGHRRLRAARAAGRPTVPVLIREMTDAEFLELLVFDNDHRQDVHPLEEAAGFQALLRIPGYDVAKIAARIAKSPAHVYARLKLLELIPQAQTLFLRKLFEAGHAVLLARLKPEDQKRAIAVGDDVYHRPALFTDERGLYDEEADEAARRKDPYLNVKAVSVREFERWIQNHVRLEPEHVDAFLFPETAAAIEAHADEGVILITRDYQAGHEVRGAGKARVYGAGAWERADGQPEIDDATGRPKKTTKCDRSRLALVACGRGQGESFLACINKEKCATHWSAWQKERTKRQAQASSPGGSAKLKEQQEQADRQRKAAEAKERDAQAAWKKAVPALRQAVAAIIRAGKVSATGAIADLVVDQIRPSKSSLIPRGKTAEDLLRYLAFEVATSDLEGAHVWSGHRDRVSRRLGELGVDVGKILTASHPKSEVQTSAGPAGKKKARR